MANQEAINVRYSPDGVGEVTTPDIVNRVEDQAFADGIAPIEEVVSGPAHVAPNTKKHLGGLALVELGTALSLAYITTALLKGRGSANDRETNNARRERVENNDRAARRAARSRLSPKQIQAAIRRDIAISDRDMDEYIKHPD